MNNYKISEEKLNNLILECLNEVLDESLGGRLGGAAGKIRDKIRNNISDFKTSYSGGGAQQQTGGAQQTGGTQQTGQIDIKQIGDALTQLNQRYQQYVSSHPTGEENTEKSQSGDGKSSEQPASTGQPASTEQPDNVDQPTSAENGDYSQFDAWDYDDYHDNSMLIPKEKTSADSWLAQKARESVKNGMWDGTQKKKDGFFPDQTFSKDYYDKMRERGVERLSESVLRDMIFESIKRQLKKRIV